jgi:hypothetical protein
VAKVAGNECVNGNKVLLVTAARGGKRGGGEHNNHPKKERAAIRILPATEAIQQATTSSRNKKTRGQLKMNTSATRINKTSPIHVGKESPTLDWERIVMWGW